MTILAGDLVIDADGKENALLPLPDYWGSRPEKLDDLVWSNFTATPMA